MESTHNTRKTIDVTDEMREDHLRQAAADEQAAADIAVAVTVDGGEIGVDVANWAKVCGKLKMAASAHLNIASRSRVRPDQVQHAWELSMTAADAAGIE